MVVSRAEKLTPEEQTGKNPLHYGEVMLYPNLGTPAAQVRGARARLLLLGLRPDPAAGQRATLEIQQGSKVMAQTSDGPGPPDARGRIAERGRAALGTLAPGAYTLKVSVPDGQGVQTREAAFTVAE